MLASNGSGWKARAACEGGASDVSTVRNGTRRQGKSFNCWINEVTLVKGAVEEGDSKRWARGVKEVSPGTAERQVPR
jgi:hypothetical protein